jgi:hypothetical protein
LKFEAAATKAGTPMLPVIWRSMPDLAVRVVSSSAQ